MNSRSSRFLFFRRRWSTVDSFNSLSCYFVIDEDEYRELVLFFDFKLSKMVQNSQRLSVDYSLVLTSKIFNCCCYKANHT